MTLADIMKDLDGLKARLSDVQNAQRRWDKQSEKVAKRYKETLDHTTGIRGKLNDLLPSRTRKAFDDMEEKIRDSSRLASDIRQKYRDHVATIEAAKQAYNGLITAGAQYEASVAKLSDSQKLELKNLQSLYGRYQTAQDSGRHKAAQKRRIEHEILMSESSKESQAAARLWHIVGNAANEHRASSKAVAAQGEELVKMRSNLAKNNRQLKDWKTFIAGASDGLIKYKRDLIIIASLVGVKSGLNAWHEINGDLIQANSALSHRVELTKANFLVSAQIGASSKKISEVQQALLARGQKQYALDKARLKTAVSLNLGLGIAVDDVAQLALYSNLTGSSFIEIGNALAVITDETNLTSKEAAKLSLTMAQVYRNLGLSTSKLPEVTTSLSAMGGRLKELGGSEGQIDRLIERFSTMQGIGNAIMFGGTNGIVKPEDFQDVNKVMAMVQNTGKRLWDMTHGDPLRMAAFEPMLRQMGMSISDARAIMQLSTPAEMKAAAERITKMNELRKNANILEERYRNQMAASGEAWNQLKTTIMGLVHAGLVPFLDLTTKILTGLNSLLTSIGKGVKDILEAKTKTTAFFKGVAKVAAYVFSAAAIGMITYGAFRVVKSLLSIGSALMKLTRGGLASSAVDVLKDAAKTIGSKTQAKTTGGLVKAIGERFKTIGSAIGRGVSGIFTKIPWGALGNTAKLIGSRIVAPIAAVWGAYKIGQLGLESFRLFKSKRQEKEAQAGVDAQKAELRARFNIPVGEDPYEWLKKQTIARGQSMSGQPYQPTVVPKQPVAPTTPARARELDVLERKFDALAKAIGEVQAAINKSADRLVKVAENGQQSSANDDRLTAENSALRTRASTVYGLEAYVS